ncbi:MULTISPECIES: restriction endonuclease subunit S [Pseudomonas]|jgi:type I restriction enzyme S subunit|uniref:restriction endonuclease subunit S n=1 Tax=Pseudomonas sp. MIL9 TaxID=2807620 RepID=UPI00102A7D78|nr:restriction endonuclease subunit S [Pseudomonas sp. MIL9]MBM6442737.1 restriction endonuclease subunit S [Pseudomonas sp. MIL9]RZO02970.1 type I restriction endonuclease subunit S [Pseudomonas moorei]
MSELPKGWATACINDLAYINPKQVFDDHLAAGFVPMSHAPTNFRDKLRFETRNWGEIKKAYTNFKSGDVIFAKVTPCFENGKAAFVEGLPNGIGAGSSEFFVLRPSSEEVSAKYLLALVKSRGFMHDGASNMTGAVGLRRVPRQFVESYSVPVPPAAEQTRIAQKLDELLAQVDTLKARIDAIPILLKRFRKSVLSASVSGRLTEKWREKSEVVVESADAYLKRIIKARREKPNLKFKEPVAPDLEKRDVVSPEGWVIASVSSFAECLDSMRVPVKKELRSNGEGLYPYFGANGEVDRVDEYIFDDDLVLVTEDETFYGREKPIAYKYSGKCWVNNHVHALRAHDLVSRDYLCFALMHYNVLPWLTGTTGRAKLTQGALLSLPIQIPPPEEQTEIVRRVEQLFAFADQLEAKVASAKTRIDHLTQSILAKAFRGELVPQDPNDEPASVLLERIKAQRAAAPKAKRGRKASV